MTAASSLRRRSPTLARSSFRRAVRPAARSGSGRGRAASSRRAAAAPGRHGGPPEGRPPHRPAVPWAASWRAWAGRPSASGWPQSTPRYRETYTTRSRSTSAAESTRPHGFAQPRKRGARGVDRDGAHRHTGQIAAAGDEGRDRVEVLAIGLQGVRRGLPRAAIGEERGEPLRSRAVDTVSLLGAVGHAAAGPVRPCPNVSAPSRLGEGPQQHNPPLRLRHPPIACTRPAQRQDRSSSLRCGRSVLTPVLTRRCLPGGRKPAKPLVDNVLTEPRPFRDDNLIETHSDVLIIVGAR